VVGGEVWAVADAEHRGLLQLVVEQSHDVALAVLIERGCRFVEKDPARFVQKDPRKDEPLLLAE